MRFSEVTNLKENIMTPQEKIALDRYNKGEKPGVSTFIDEDTIIMGYGNLGTVDFEYPLPYETIKSIYGTNSWKQYFINKGVYQYISTNKTTDQKSITPYLTDQEFEKVAKENPNFTFEKI